MAKTYQEAVKIGYKPARFLLIDRLAHAVETIQSGDRSRPYDRSKLDSLIAIFKQRFPSFTSQEYLDSERTYKLMAAERLQTLIGREIIQRFIDQGQFEEAKAAIIKSGQGSFKISDTIRQPNNLLNQWDLHVLGDAPAEPLMRRLYDLLYGDTPFVERFDALADMLTQKKRGEWQPITYFLILRMSKRHWRKNSRDRAGEARPARPAVSCLLTAQSTLICPNCCADKGTAR